MNGCTTAGIIVALGAALVALTPVKRPHLTPAREGRAEQKAKAWVAYMVAKDAGTLRGCTNLSVVDIIDWDSFRVMTLAEFWESCNVTNIPMPKPDEGDIE